MRPRKRSNAFAAAMFLMLLGGGGAGGYYFLVKMPAQQSVAAGARAGGRVGGGGDNPPAGIGSAKSGSSAVLASDSAARPDTVSAPVDSSGPAAKPDGASLVAAAVPGAKAARPRTGRTPPAAKRDSQPTTCDIAEFSTNYNRDGSCFDNRPVAMVPTLVPLTPETEGRPTPAILLLAINADGIVERILIKSPSDNPQFTLEARRFAQSITYNPAQRNGEPVGAWVEMLFRPARR
jgi:hypothetical protein